MKKHVLVNSFLLVVVIVLGIGVGLGLARIKAARSSATQGAISQSEQAEDTRPLSERARQAGRYISNERPSRANAFSDLARLADSSSAVIIGIPQRNVTNLTPDGRSVTIDYEVRVEHSFRGSLRQGSAITVSLPGGMVAFEDGSTAEIRTPWFRKMQEGKAYALFLRPRGWGNSFVTTGGPQGVFEIPTTRDSRAVRAHSGLPNDPMWRYHNVDVRAFLREVRRVTNSSR